MRKKWLEFHFLCRLIAEVCANKVHFYSTTGTKNFDLPLKIDAMYQQFIDQRIESITKNSEEFQSIKIYHIERGLKHGFHNDEIFSAGNKVAVQSKVLQVGIIQLQSSTRLEFIHRTFAEYFVAEYFSVRLHHSATMPLSVFRKIFKKSNEIRKFLAILLAWHVKKNQLFILENTFMHSVSVSFVDFSLNDANIFEEIKKRIASFLASISSEKLLSILCACCHHNFYNMFSLLKEALMKWNWFQRTGILRQQIVLSSWQCVLQRPQVRCFIAAFNF